MTQKRINKRMTDISEAAERRALQVECPTCGAKPGKRCATSGGNLFYTYGPAFNETYHKPRLRLADSMYTVETLVNR